MSNEERNLHEFAESRGFTEEELAKWGIHVRGRDIIIPLRGGSGTWVNRIHRPEGTPKYRPERSGVGAHLYNPLHLGPNTGQVWIAEGEFDTLSLVTVGASAVGVLGASGFRRPWARLFVGAKVVVAFDPDSESDEQRSRVGNLMALFPQVIRFDPLKVGGYNDINDWFRADRQSLKAAVARWSEGNEDNYGSEIAEYVNAKTEDESTTTTDPTPEDKP